MPFKKQGKYFASPSGKRYTRRQVRAYYATNGFTRKPHRRKVKWRSQ